MTVGAAAGEARDVLDRGNAPVQAASTVPTTNARRDSRVASIMELEAHIRELPFSVAVLGIEVATFEVRRSEEIAPAFEALNGRGEACTS